MHMYKVQTEYTTDFLDSFGNVIKFIELALKNSS